MDMRGAMQNTGGSTNPSIFLCLVNVTQANCALTTNFWTSGYAALCIYIHKDCYVYLVIMYSVHVELAVSPVNAGYLVRTVSLCYT